MDLIIGLVWLLLSIIAIAIDQDRWDGLFKVFMASSIIAFLVNGWRIYDPNAVTGTAVTIELNPTWDMALISSFAWGACITGPIAAIHAFQDWLYYDRHININPFRKTTQYDKEARSRLLEKEKALKDKQKRDNKTKTEAKNLCRKVSILEIVQDDYRRESHLKVTASFTIKNTGKHPVTDIHFKKNVKMEQITQVCIIEIALGDRLLKPGEQITAEGKGSFYNSQDIRPIYEYSYKTVDTPNNAEKSIKYRVDCISREAYVI